MLVADPRRDVRAAALNGAERRSAERAELTGRTPIGQGGRCGGRSAFDCYGPNSGVEPHGKDEDEWARTR